MIYEKLLVPGKIGNVEIKNRVFMPPMAVCMGDGSGLLSEREIGYYEERAKGGAGLLISSAFAVDDETAAIIEPGQVLITKPGTSAKIGELVERVHAHGAKIAIQLLHPGRQAASAVNNGKQPVGPSAIKEADFLEMPREMTTAEVKIMIEKFINAAKISLEAGADGIELHGAHGYMISQFMSERANKRTDQYGGSFENRMRFITEIVEGIKGFKPENAMLFIRINATDNVEGGQTLEEGIEKAQYLEKIGIEAIDISRSTYSSSFLVAEGAPFPEGCRSDWVKKVKQSLTVPILAVNHIKRPETAENILREGISDFVGLGRALLADPYFINKVKAGKEKNIRTCISCCHCIDSMITGSDCSVNPYVGREVIYNENSITRNGANREVVVIGGGPGGIQAALTAARRGFHVTLFESNSKLGGALELAAKATGKDKVEWLISSYLADIKDSENITIRLNSRIEGASGINQIKKLNPYAVIIAAGGKPVVPNIPGMDGKNVILAHDVLKGVIKPRNSKIAIVGSGLTGLETGEVLLSEANKITVYDMLDQISKDANVYNRQAEMDILSEGGTEFKTLYRLEKITEKGPVFTDLAVNKTVEENADVVVLSLGVKPDNSIFELFSGVFERVKAIGDCAGGNKIAHATRAGHEEAWNI
jgi:2,4-dienoyl-CoA reductase-like NADH-dependent reductase (Old Yellow Enzyme family)/thioredoxin reductase